MDSSLAAAGAGLTAGLLTLFDLDRTFYIPTRVRPKLELYLWWWTFILANGAIAALLYGAVGDVEALREIHPFVKALIVGGGYLALIRAKFTTFDFQGKDVPFGFELIYESAKSFVYRQINTITREARWQETKDLADKYPLAELARQAKLRVDQDSLLSADEKRATKAWILRVLQDTASDDEEKRLVLANYLLSGQIPAS